MTRLRLIIYAIILIVLIFLGFFIKTLLSQINDLNSYKSLYESVNKENKIWRSKDSLWHNKSDVAIISKSELTAIKELQGISEEFKGLKKSLRNLENYTKLSEVTTINKTVYLKDSVFTYVTKFDTITGVINGDSVLIKASLRDDLTFVQYWDRSWFLGKKKYLMEIKSDNPNTKVVYQKSIRTERKRGLF